jgi:hypothetical protein
MAIEVLMPREMVQVAAFPKNSVEKTFMGGNNSPFRCD